MQNRQHRKPTLSLHNQRLGLVFQLIILCKNNRAYIPGGNVAGIRKKATQIGHVGLAVWGGKKNLWTTGICDDGDICDEEFSFDGFRDCSGTDLHFWTCTITPLQLRAMKARVEQHKKTAQANRYREFAGFRLLGCYNCITFVDSVLSAGLGIHSKIYGQLTGWITPWYYSQSFFGQFGWNHSVLKGKRHN